MIQGIRTSFISQIYLLTINLKPSKLSTGWWSEHVQTNRSTVQSALYGKLPLILETRCLSSVSTLAPDTMCLQCICL